ncbi:MAG: hypothetical protein EBZ06_05215, partial [Betaproteobacteria bacterium]|nr:hypothetical protein [Betaproteobacteria bacterium]
MKFKYRALAFAAIALVHGHGAWAGEAEAKKWVDSEFQPSTLSKEKQLAELKREHSPRSDHQHSRFWFLIHELDWA